MEVTLRKAAALETALRDTARNLPLAKTVTISVYSTEEVAASVKAAQDKFEANAADAAALIRASYDIRAAIGAANASNGISALLTEKASLDAVEKLLSGATKTASSADYGVVSAEASVAEAQLGTMRKRLESSDNYHSADSISVSILSPDLSEGFKAQLTKIQLRKVSLADELLGLNMTKKVTLSPDAVSLLNKFSLV